MPILSTSKVIGYLYLTWYKSNINYPLIDYGCPTGYKCGLQFPTRLAVSPVIKFVSFTKIKSAKDVLLWKLILFMLLKFVRKVNKAVFIFSYSIPNWGSGWVNLIKCKY